ncbi:MATE family efflux transporter [uncultured Desulfovibrio sp.]|uniref:MATE family efflux transporter n=1 Tax=uncultured Desulfovibrio sp. TaxID=167968 RepID=UPI002634A205|nr:MATE family efflux transporter [uncultured Desulfovibrio sp.]
MQSSTSQRARWSSLWTLTWPQILTLLVQFGIGLTDVWAAGHIGPDIQASIGLIAQCNMVLMTIGIATGNGAVAAVSQSLGAGRDQRARRFVGLVLFAGLGAGILLACLGGIFQAELLALMRTPEHLLPSAALFLEISLWSLPGQYLLTISTSVLRSARIVLLPLGVMLLAGAANIWGDLAFGLGWWGFPRYGAAGLAWASLGSILLGAVILLVIIRRAGFLRRDALPPLRWARRGGGYLLRVGLPALGTSVLWQTGFVLVLIITMTLPHDGVGALAGLTVGMRIEAVIFLPAVACQMAVAVLVGQSLGRGDRAEAQRVAYAMLLFAVLGMGLLTVILWFLRHDLAAMMSPDPAVREETVHYLVFNFLSAPVMVANLVLVGVFIGAGATRYSMWSYLISVWCVRLPLSWWLGHKVMDSSSGVYWAMIISQIVQFAQLFWTLLYADWKRYALTGRAS